MSTATISVEGLGKAYRIGLRAEAHRTLREALVGLAKAPFQRYQRLGERRTEQDTFWALRDVDFQISRGEVVGIIGRNGAGKSTLLKVLSRITEPTEGCVRLRGRVASLLEVGTGFHPELSGRENIYLNGAILGMRRSEIDSKFDGIVDFAGVEKFLDTPVKRYSSGMYVRLAFAVAAHLEPEILIVDEVLAVGDAEFQRKCLGKMQEVARGEGRTVLFVSHNMSAVQRLCPRAILMRQGRKINDGPSDVVIREYLAALSAGAEDAFGDNPERGGNGRIRLTAARILDEAGQPTRRVVAGRRISIEFDYDNPETVHEATANMQINNQHGFRIANLNMRYTGFDLSRLKRSGSFRCTIDRLPLCVGEHRIGIVLMAEGQEVDVIPNALVFDVDSSAFYSTGHYDMAQWGACMIDHSWEHIA
jgi:lipopolysaccharide transport system ATP-binding protein